MRYGPRTLRFVLAIAGLAASVAPSSTGAAQPASPTPRPVSLVVSSADGTGPFGTAILTPADNGVQVTVKFAIRQSIDANAAILRGTCVAPGAGSVAYRLNPVVHGLSQTLLRGVSLRTLTSGRYAIVLRYTPTLCGDLGTATRG
ncbi:MAG TPA: hypothetical protein VMA36_15675 [Candidatus Limnocylindria bacterium]|jgi:hypothetical protein|nr:hypothetical protein [Candidatus Limnocylindria bacterium]